MAIEKKHGVPWTAAEAAIGEEDGNDWKLEPLTHAESLPPEAARLKAVLGQERIKTHMKAYKRYDEEAETMQKRYRFWRKILRLLVFLAAVAGLLALGVYWYGGRIEGVWYRGRLSDEVLALLLLHAVLVGVIGYMALRFRVQDWRGRWKDARAQAELRRVAIFAEACKPNPAAATAEVTAAPGVTLLDLAPLQLAYFRRYQLDVQLNYLRGRGAQLRKVKATPTGLTWSAMAVAVVSVLLAILLGLSLAAEQGFGVPVWLMSVLRPEIASVAPILLPLLLISSFYAVRVNVDPSEDAQNGLRFEALYENLDYLKQHGYAAAQRAAEAGDLTLVQKFIDLVHDRMRAEAEGWIRLSKIGPQDADDDASAAVNGLAELLEAERSLPSQG